MRRIRPILPLFLATAALLVLSVGGPAAAVTDLAANRGWCSPLRALEGLAAR